MAYILPTVVLWVGFFLLVPAPKQRSFYPVLLFSALLGTVSDLCGVIFRQWVYYGPVVGGLSLWSDLGIAPAESALFVRFFPQRENAIRVRLGYLCAWALVNAFFEWFFVQVGWIGYREWNSVKAFLFYIFYFSLIWVQEYWYNGTGMLRKKKMSRLRESD